MEAAVRASVGNGIKLTQCVEHGRRDGAPMDEVAMMRQIPRQIVTTALIAVALFGAPAFAKSKPHKPSNASGTITYDRESKDPNVGWRWVKGMRTCTQDCENPEIPGSGYTCRNVGSGWRACVSN
jgi:hypothetical protein